MATIVNSIQANLIAESLSQITGEKPQVINSDSVTYIRYSPDQQIKVRTWLDKQLSKKHEPGAIRIEFEPVIYPLAIKKVLPYIILLLLGGFLLGNLSK